MKQKSYSPKQNNKIAHLDISVSGGQKEANGIKVKVRLV